VNRIARFVEYLSGRVVRRSGLRKRAKEPKKKKKNNKNKKKPKVSNFKKTLTMAICWLTEGQKQDEK
jgi:hypothetical protein